MRLLRRLWFMLRQRQFESDLAEEIRFHREMTERELARDGHPPDDVGPAARRALGSMTLAHERSREVWVWPCLESLVYDLRFALRGLLRDRPFALTAIAMLALAIALNVVSFTIMDAMLFRGLPMATRSGRLAYLAMRRPADPACCPGPVSYSDLEAWRAEAPAFTGLALNSGLQRLSFRGAAGRSVDVEGQRVTANTFDLLGVLPILGRNFAVADEAPTAAPVALISHRLWERLFAKADVIGATVHIDDIATTIIGVMPEGFALVYDYDLWLPIVPTPSLQGGVIGRLTDGATLEEARAQIDTITHRLHSTDPSRQHDIPRVATYSQAFLAPDGPVIYGGLWVGACFVLLIACANLANLTMVRTLRRGRELSTKMALGAGLRRIARQIVVEHLILAAAAGTLAWWITRATVHAWASATASRYLAIDYTVDSNTLLYLIAMTMAAAIGVALIPLARVMQLGVHGSILSNPRGATRDPRGKRLAAALVTSQMTLALVLLLGAGVLVRSFEKIVNADTGVGDPDHVVVGRVRLPSGSYPTADSRLVFYDRLEAQVRTIPGVENVSLSSTLPGRMVNPAEFEVEGTPRAAGSERSVQVLVAGSDYFGVMGAPPVDGRSFNNGDNLSALPVAIVNERFVDTFSSKIDPIGKRFRTIAQTTPGPWRTIVGVVPNIMQGDPTRQSFRPVVYVPAKQSPSGAAFLFARTTLPDHAASAIRTATQRLDPDVIEEDFKSLTTRLAFNRDFMDLEHAELGKQATVAPVFATTALLLSAVGLFAVIAQSVTQRTKEIGIRIAIGAVAADVRRMVFREAMVPVGIGLFAGLAMSLAVNRVLQSQLVGVSPYDPLTMISAPIILIVVALIACHLPARRAMQVDPVIALRCE
jgi:predicted permease